MIVHYLLLHDLFPAATPGMTIPMFTGMGGLILLPVLWRRRRPLPDGTQLRPRPPILRLFLIAGVIAAYLASQASLTSNPSQLEWELIWAAAPFAAPFMILGPELFGVWCGITLCWMGIGTVVWWTISGVRGGVSGDMATTSVPSVAEEDVQSAKQACAACTESARTGGGPPLARTAHNSDGPRFLYRCSACHSYWEKDVKGMRPISTVKAKRDFADATI